MTKERFAGMYAPALIVMKGGVIIFRIVLFQAILVLFLVFICDAGSDKLMLFEKNGKFGYRDKQANVVIQPGYIIAHDFSKEGIAMVVDDEGWAYIDKKGNLVIRPFVYDNGPDYFSEGLARFVKKGKFGFFDKTGKVVIFPKFDFSFPFKEDLSVVCNGCVVFKDGEHSLVKGGNFGYIDKKGNFVIPLEFEDARNFSNGKAKVKREGKWITINKKGEIEK